MRKIMLCGVLAASIFVLGVNHTAHAQETEKRAPTNVYDGHIRVAEGAKYKMRFFARTQSTQEIPGSPDGKRKSAPITSSSIMKFGADYDVISVDSFGNHQARITYGEFNMSVNSTYNGKSQSPKVKAEAEKKVNEYLKVMDGATFIIKTSPKNEVMAVYGLSALKARLLSKLPISGGARAQANAMLSNLLSDQTISKNFGKLNGQLPAYPIRVSESWDYTIPSADASSFVPDIKGRRTLVSLTDGVASIKDEGTFTMNKPLSDKTPVGISMEGTQNAVTRIDNATGMPLEMTMTQVVTGTVTTKNDGSGETLKSPMTSTTLLRLVVEKE